MTDAIRVEEGRFTRFESIKWWRQERLRAARVLVIGAGALGNEVVKNLALLGVGHIRIVDMDRIEASNLSRSVLFRPSDEGQSKAEAAARAARDIYPEIQAEAIICNAVAQLGLGEFRWAEAVIGAVDNREARVFINRACAQVQRPWVDGGIDVLNGIVRGFFPPASACYECTMGQADWDLLAKRRSCALLARQAVAEGGAPTTPTTASIIGAIQAQEVVKRLHGLECLTGRGYLFEGLNHNSYSVNYAISPECPWHSEPAPVEACPEFGADAPLRGIWRRAAQILPGLQALDLSREIVESFHCPACGTKRPVRKPVELVSPAAILCPSCKSESVPQFCHSLTEDSPLLELTASELGLPAWDVIWARNADRMLGIEMAKDQRAAHSR